MAAVEKSEPAPALGNPGELCCGGRHAPNNRDKPLGLGCQLCSEASIYYANEPGYRARRAANPGAYPAA